MTMILVNRHAQSVFEVYGLYFFPEKVGVTDRNTTAGT